MDSEEHKVKDSPTRQGKGKTNEKESVDEGERQHPNSTRPMPFDNVESNSTTKAQSQRDEVLYHAMLNVTGTGLRAGLKSSK